jgi:hypothetical protein
VTTPSSGICGFGGPLPKRAKLIVAICTGRVHAQRRRAVRETWLRTDFHSSVVARFYGGGSPELWMGEPDVIGLNCGDRYEDLPMKTFALVEFLCRRVEFEHLLKCDDDTYLFPRAIGGLDLSSVDYGGEVHGTQGVDRWWHSTRTDGPVARTPYQGPWLGPWAGGGAYILSRAAATTLVRYGAATFARELFEDKAVGDLMRAHGVKLVDLGHRFRTHRRGGLGILTRDICALHPVSISEMYEVHAAADAR